MLYNSLMLPLIKLYFIKYFALLLFFLPARFRNFTWLADKALPEKHKKHARLVSGVTFLFVSGFSAYYASKDGSLQPFFLTVGLIGLFICISIWLDSQIEEK